MDIRLSYKTEFELPVEVKRESNRGLWTGLRTQLIDQYAIAREADGFGIYLVLWFGGYKITMSGGDGGKKPRSPEELQARLVSTLDLATRRRIFVFVMDVSLPADS